MLVIAQYLNDRVVVFHVGRSSLCALFSNLVAVPNDDTLVFGCGGEKFAAVADGDAPDPVRVPVCQRE